MKINISTIMTDTGHHIATIFVDLTRAPDNKMVSWTDPSKLIDTADYFAEINNDINGLIAGGWHTQHPDRDKGITLWHHLVESCNHPDATDDVKALKLVVPEGL